MSQKRSRKSPKPVALSHPVQPDELAALVEQFGSPLLLVDCEVIRQQYRALQDALPGVDLHYALKPLPVAAVVRALDGEGAWFDLATAGEVALVRDLGIAAARCIHTHPIKRDADIRAALDYGVTTFVADNRDEIDKFLPYRDRVELLLRISFRSPHAIVDLSRKFGCDPDAALELAARAHAAGIRVRGLSFHVGSQSGSPDAHVRAIKACAQLIEKAAKQGLPAFELLDIGGGFPIDYLQPVPAIRHFCRPIVKALAKLPPGLRLIAEPGRFISGPAGLCLTTVMGRAFRDGRWWYYLDDGLYGSFSGQLFDHARYPIEPLLHHPGPRLPSVLAGPTCDSIDVVAEDILLPELQAGDVLLGRQMGAYTCAHATDFNFFPRARIVAVNELPAT